MALNRSLCHIAVIKGILHHQNILKITYIEEIIYKMHLYVGLLPPTTIRFMTQMNAISITPTPFSSIRSFICTLFAQCAEPSKKNTSGKWRSVGRLLP